MDRFIVTDEDPEQIKLYNCLGFVATFRAFWMFPAPQMTPVEHEGLIRLGQDAFLATAEGKVVLARVGPDFMQSLGYDFFPAEPKKGPVIAMYAGDQNGPHVAKRLREGRPWYEGKCGPSGRVVHRLEDLTRCAAYGRVIGFWAPTDATPQRWAAEARRRASVGEPSLGPILDSAQTDGDLLWTMIAELEGEERT